jgi:hypothetical protein
MRARLSLFLSILSSTLSAVYISLSLSLLLLITLQCWLWVLAAAYRDSVAACGLQHDINTLPALDETVVGDQGSTLSGGQKQRLGLGTTQCTRTARMQRVCVILEHGVMFHPPGVSSRSMLLSFVNFYHMYVHPVLVCICVEVVVCT